MAVNIAEEQDVLHLGGKEDETEKRNQKKNLSLGEKV